MSINRAVAGFAEMMAGEAARQRAFEVSREVAKMNRGVTHISSLRVGEGGRKQGAGNSNTVAPLYRYRDPSSDLINAIVGINWHIRRTLERYPASEDLQAALQITTGLGMESADTVIKAIPHIRALIPDYMPDRDLLMRALKQAQRYAEQERDYAVTTLHFSC
jgi:hypothetical protein